MPGDLKTNPLYILMFLFVLVLVGGLIFYFVASFLGVNLNQPSNNGSFNNQTFNNDSVAKGVANTGINDIEYSIPLIIVAGLFFDIARGWYAPNKLIGVLNVFLIFVAAYLWLNVVGVLSSSGLALIFIPLNGPVSYSPVIYDLLISPYFIMGIAFMLGLGAVVNFRSVDEQQMEDNGYDRRVPPGGSTYYGIHGDSL